MPPKHFAEITLLPAPPPPKKFRQNRHIELGRVFLALLGHPGVSANGYSRRASCLASFAQRALPSTGQVQQESQAFKCVSR